MHPVVRTINYPPVRNHKDCYSFGPTAEVRVNDTVIQRRYAHVEVIRTVQSGEMLLCGCAAICSITMSSGSQSVWVNTRARGEERTGNRGGAAGGVGWGQVSLHRTLKWTKIFLFSFPTNWICCGKLSDEVEIISCDGSSLSFFTSEHVLINCLN